MLFWALIGAIVGSRVAYVIAHVSEFSSPLEWLYVWKGGISLLGGITGAIVINIRRMHKYGYRFFQVMDPAAVALAIGIGIGRIGDLIIGDHLGKPTSWLLAWTYHGGNLAPPFTCLNGVCQAQLQRGSSRGDPTVGREAHRCEREGARDRRRGPSDRDVRHDPRVDPVRDPVAAQHEAEAPRASSRSRSDCTTGAAALLEDSLPDRQAVRTVHRQPVDRTDGRDDLGGSS